MTDSDQDDSNRYRIDRRTILKLAGVTGGSAAFTGIGLANSRGNGSRGTDPNSPGFERIEPERPPPWAEINLPPEDPARDLWFVEFAAPPTVRGGKPVDHANERSRLRAQARREGITCIEKCDFTTLWNGLSVRTDPASVTTLRGLDDVIAVSPVAVVEPTGGDPEVSTPEGLESALEMTGVDQLQDRGLSGTGLRIAIIDSGIDYNHPDLGGSGDPDVVYTAESEADRTLTGPDGEVHPRISHGWDYVGNTGFDASEPESPPPEPDPDPADRIGHGTHVAGIAGADAATDGVTGAAPAVTFGAYKVFDVGATTEDVIIEALEDAFEDGMDIVNMSLGAALTWGNYPTIAASNELVNQGVAVIAAAGNSAALGMWSTGAPAVADDVISVASAENSVQNPRVFRVAELEESVPYFELAGGMDAPPTDGESAPLALPARSEIMGQEGYFGCAPEDFEDFPEGHVALIERGHCFISEKYLNAAEAGASGVVIFNDTPGLFASRVREIREGDAWGATISGSNGGDLVSLIQSEQEVTLKFTDERLRIENPDAGLLSSFSSYGQDPDLDFSPSITAPGGMIPSTWPLTDGEYAVVSGTSMSAPHVAGAVALLLEAEPDLNPLELRDRLQNTAEPAAWSLAPAPELTDHTFRQGAGMLQIDGSLGAEQQVLPGHVAVGEGATNEATLTLHNGSDEAVEYAVEHVGAIGASVSTFAPTFLLPGSEIDVPATVTVPANGSTRIDVMIDAPGFGLPNHQYGGYIVLTPDDEDRNVLRVPYSGYDGDYQELDLFGYYAWTDASPEPEFIEQEPILSAIVYGEDGGIQGLEPVDPGHTFTLSEGDFPVVEAFFGHYPQTIRMWAVRQSSGRAWPILIGVEVLEGNYLPRSPDSESFFPIVWDGTAQILRGQIRYPVPSGTYTLRVEVLHTLGDPEKQDHWDRWESPALELDAQLGPARGQETAPVGLPASFVWAGSS